MEPRAHQGLNPQALIPARHDPRFARVFAWYNRRLVGKRFHRVLACADTLELAREMNQHEGPLLIVLNHSSWWDPLIVFALADAILPSRVGIAPMDRAQLERFAFFRRLGMFGIDPDEPASLEAMRSYALGFLAEHPRATLAITPQGRFVDPRVSIRNRPGIASIAAGAGPDVRVLSIAFEYAFWEDKRAEVLVRFASVRTPTESTTASWHRAIEGEMQRNSDELARVVIARAPSAFVPVLGGRGARINPIYDAWLRLRGKGAAISGSRRPHAPPSRPGQRDLRLEEGASQ